MPFEVEKDGKTIKVWTQEEVDAEVRGLKVTNENLKAEKQEALDKVREAKEQIREAEEARAKAEGDNETLRRIADEREAEKRQAIEDERKKFSDLLNMTKKEKVENYITSILDEVKPADSTRAKHLRKLLKADFEFDVDLEKNEFTVRGENVTSADDLKKLLREGEEYQYYLAGSGATGGGATGGKPSGAGSKWADFTPAELSEIRKSDPGRYEQLKKTR
jgi:flagellar biosynthesis GTPase FlhF